MRKHVLDGPRLIAEIGHATYWDDQTVTEENAQVVVRNQGRGATFINHIMLCLPDGRGTMEVPDYQPEADVQNRPLGGYESVTVELGLAAVHEYLVANDLDECAVVAECHLGSGHVIESSELMVRRVPRIEPGGSAA